ncbi:MAG TPA: DUF1801 domain-containing protein [Capsulimonadaceae bacterium]|jgi:uncharacterized protein YdhG (YjbR/CyaY superfamily)
MSVYDDYLETVKPDERVELDRIRSIVSRVVPDTEDGLSYGMPTVKYRGKGLISFMAAKKHLSIYPMSGKVVDKLRDKLTAYSLSAGTIRFSASNPIPEALVEEIILTRKREIDEKLG